MASHFLYASPDPYDSLGDRLRNSNAAPCWNELCLSGWKHQILLSCQSSERAHGALNPGLNCVHFLLTSSEISAADTKEVLKACFDSSRLDCVVFLFLDYYYSFQTQIVCPGGEFCVVERFILFFLKTCMWTLLDSIINCLNVKQSTSN